MQEGISKQQAIEILGQQGPTVVFGIIQALVQVKPEWAILFVIATGLINTWNEFGQARTKELVDDINKHRDEYLPEIVESDKFKSVFVNAIQRHITEASVEKRRILRQYILNIGRGVSQEFEYHTKVFSIIDQITFEELEVISAWSGRLQQALVAKNSNIIQSSDDEDKVTKDLNEHQVMSIFEDRRPSFSPEQLEFILKSLGNYGLLDVREFTAATYDGGTYGLVVKDITPFGKEFLKSINESPEKI